MNLERRSEIIEELVTLEKEIMETKGKEYATEEDTLDNFKIIGKILGKCPLEVCTVYMMKHMLAIADYAKRKETLSEDIRGRILDLRVYAMLFYALTEDLNE